jgi:hypothetical protein
VWRRTVTDERNFVIVVGGVRTRRINAGLFESHGELNGVQAIDVIAVQAIEIIALHATVISRAPLE